MLTNFPNKYFRRKSRKHFAVKFTQNKHLLNDHILRITSKNNQQHFRLHYHYATGLQLESHTPKPQCTQTPTTVTCHKKKNSKALLPKEYSYLQATTQHQSCRVSSHYQKCNPKAPLLATAMLNLYQDRNLSQQFVPPFTMVTSNTCMPIGNT